ncbi:MFS transporter [Conexibacter sp. S30A1]|uniref:MFS transporter n=1 Tax=Conexibacter sp. S30A1 TaxID=2937800 RepID=UPI00200D4FC2|nr:MFS transporter [Conexibacter sp. S30A1]
MSAERGPAARADHWAVIGAYALAGAANQMLWLTFTPVTTPAARHYGVSASDIGLLAEIFPLLYVLLAVPAASLLDRWFRPTLMAGTALTAAGGLLRLGGDTFAWALAGQALVALAQPLILNAVTGLASGYLSERSRPVGIAIGSAGIFLGMLMSLVLGAAVGGSHLHTLLVIDAVFAVITAAGLLGALALAPALALSGDVTGLFGLGSVWREPGIRRLATVSFVGFGLFIALTTWLQTLLKPAGIPASTAGWVLVGAVVAGVIGSIVLPPTVIRRQADHLLFRAAGLSTCGACVLFAVWKWVPAVAAGAALIGFFMLAALPVILEIAERRAGPAGTSATALIWLAGNAGGIVIALLVQAVVGTPLVAFLLMAAVAAVVLRVVWRGSLSGELAPDAATMDATAVDAATVSG